MGLYYFGGFRRGRTFPFRVPPSASAYFVPEALEGRVLSDCRYANHSLQSPPLHAQFTDVMFTQLPVQTITISYVNINNNVVWWDHHVYRHVGDSSK